MVQFSKNVKKKKNNERIDEVSDPLYFLKDQTSHYINICISSSKMVFYKKSFFYWLFVNYPYIYNFFLFNNFAINYLTKLNK